MELAFTPGHTLGHVCLYCTRQGHADGCVRVAYIGAWLLCNGFAQLCLPLAAKHEAIVRTWADSVSVALQLMHANVSAHCVSANMDCGRPLNAGETDGRELDVFTYINWWVLQLAPSLLLCMLLLSCQDSEHVSGLLVMRVHLQSHCC